MQDDELEQRASAARNAWYFYVPPAMLGIWLVVAVARVIAFILDPAGMLEVREPEGATDSLRLAIDVVDWLGGVGWVLLFFFSFMLLSRKRAPGWLLLGAFCPGPNLLLYAALLVMSKRPHPTAAVPSNAAPVASDEALRSPSLLQDSFVCESCHALLNYGVSECRECGELYRYVQGTPQVDDPTQQRERQ